jgi:3D (Asp-Asp-Asp) domain-containing protein
MKKFIIYSVTVASLAYYVCVPILVANASAGADITTTDPTSTAGTVGTAGITTPVMAPSPTAPAQEVLAMRVTAYASVPDETDNTPFITADGSYVHDGIAASNILPFGTEIEIPQLFGDKIFTIHDRMSAKIKNTIDIWMPSVQQAIVFGVSHVKIIVLGTVATIQAAKASQELASIATPAASIGNQLSLQ